ncbi:yippee zinc-binding/DNA-binding /Mis18, centromere assembly-domain-containing protein [Podospora didyma]|uniref:Yippee zinc-binding/DNA-binding /Mis18, centromere assembly-domain-containing protein n=1 Tax=Podospora didyma TaxID=330526 RepID=A0AAE0N4I0_9PEZI|nr:yippee zinc-binding/DNA-binding /Mis18, centromere assembly-domain-containing protein [Podospora didyma]
MFGDITAALTRPTAAAASPALDDGPTFPLYLLPSFTLPFRHRRPSASPRSSPISAQPAAHHSPLPSLSSSPGSDTTCVGSPGTPRIVSPPTGPRVSRTQPDTLRCGTCATDLAFSYQIISRGFQGRHGRAFLVSPPSGQPTPNCPGSPLNTTIISTTHSTPTTKADLINIRVGRPENRQLVTGAHVVADITCAVCTTKLGWKYVDAQEVAQKYKVGKFILETQRVVAHHSWEDIDHTLVGEQETATTTRDNKRLWRRRRRASKPHVQTIITKAAEDVSDEDVSDEDDVIVFDSDDEDECEDIFAGVWDPETVAKRRRGKVSNMWRAGGASAA